MDDINLPKRKYTKDNEEAAKRRAARGQGHEAPKGKLFLFMWNYGRDTGNQLAASKSKTFLGGGNPNLCTNKQLLSEVFRFYIAKNIEECGPERNNTDSAEPAHFVDCSFAQCTDLPSTLAINHRINNKGTAVCLCVVINWQPSQTYSAAFQSLWPASRNQCSDTVWPRRSVSFTVCQRPQNFLAFITISWRQISGEFSHGTWLLHFRNSSESIRKNHDCNGDRHTR